MTESQSNASNGADQNAKDQQLFKDLRVAVDRLHRAVDQIPEIGKGYELCISHKNFAQLIELHRKSIKDFMSKLYSNVGYRSKFTDGDDLSQVIEANNLLEEKIAVALDRHKAEATGSILLVPAMEKTAESHGGVPVMVPQTTAFGKDSGGRYGNLGSNPKKKEDIGTIYHRGLFVAKNLPKPQIAFQEHINNADAPFVPKLRVKHNAKPRPEDKIKIIDDDIDNDKKSWNNDKDTLRHPYEYELATFEIPEDQLTISALSIEKPLNETPYTIVNSTNALLDLVKNLNSVKRFAVDLEHHNYRSFLGLTCLVQISILERDFIIDPFPIWGEMWRLNEPFSDPNILKIFHGGDWDVQWLQRDFGIYVVNMFDTHIAMKVLKMSRLSLQYLVEMMHGITLGKELQKADWRIRPLTAEHIRYARSDTHYLLYCYERLKNDLLERPDERNLLDSVYKQSSNLCLKIYEQPRYSDDDYLKLVSTRRPTNQQSFALRELWKWRDATARETDESHSFVLPDYMLTQIADILPQETAGILSCCSPVPIYVKRDLLILHKIVQAAREIPLDRSSILGKSDDSLMAAFTRALADRMEMSPFEKRLNEMFSCDCNEAIVEKMEEDDGDVRMDTSEAPDFIFVVGESENENASVVERLSNARDKVGKFYPPYAEYEIAIEAGKKEGGE